MNNKRKRKLGCVMSAVLIGISLLNGTPAVKAETAVSFDDIQGHWAAQQIVAGAAQGIISGYGDGMFKPEKEITRAEFMAVINRTFGYTEKAEVDFTDVKTGDWFYGEVAKAEEAGYVTGYDDGTIKPDSSITREEVAVMVSRIIELEQNDESQALDSITDAVRMGSWSKGFIGAIVEAGYMRGYPDGSYKPTKPITRAESIALLSKVMGNLYNKPGSYGPEKGQVTVVGNVTVASTGVKLRNMDVKGNLYLTEGIGDGEVSLDDVTVSGKTFIKGGGPNSIVVTNSELGITIIDTKTGNVRVLASGSTKIGKVTLNSGAKLEESDLTGTGFEECELSLNIPEGEEVIFDGEFEMMDVASSNVNISLQGGKVNNLQVGEGIEGTKIDVANKAQVSNMTLNAPIGLNIGSDAEVSTLILNAAVSITGQGNIANAVIKVDGVTMEKMPAAVEFAEGVTATVNGEQITQKTPSIGGGVAAPVTTVNPAGINSACAVIGSTSIVAQKVDGSDNSFIISIPSNINDSDKFTHISIEATQNAKQIEARVSILSESRSKTVTLSNGQAYITAGDILAAFGGEDNNNDGITFSEIKGYISLMMVDGDLVDDQNNRYPISITFTIE
ncbi:S-layer homology domain-containing protein [Petroclostridium sp. X23]|uniref:S-layer homology domain-containing protein n=1 Tax=Petroclostridium sp. X23 TaxID=3045146 RepID=UPI0024ACA86D|nr:S-layer homology domain-containing protein [Petroclostridium sp. X23]WHH57523.1 S-layer homology domain-containing protein [Petroclostridium sp. X23]